MGVFQNIVEWVWLNPVFTALFVGGAILLYYSYATGQKNIERKKRKESMIQMQEERPNAAKKVGKVYRLLLYPLKSAKAITEGESLIIGDMGMKTSDGLRDRTWMVTLENGTMMSMRAEPRLVLIEPSISPSGAYLMLDAPNMPTLLIDTDLNQHNSPTLDVNVWGLHSQAVNCGKEAADWICTYLGKKGFLIVYHAHIMSGRKVKDGPYSMHKAFDDNDRVGFADAAPLILMAEGSINDVKRKVRTADVSTMNFRPNVVIKGPKPYEEDDYDEVHIGENVILKRRMLATRCLGCTVDTVKGEKNANKEPLQTLNSYRPKIKSAACLGLYMGVVQGGEVHVGDDVYAVKKKYNVEKDFDSLEGDEYDGTTACEVTNPM